MRILDREAASSSKKAQQLQVGWDLAKQQCDALTARVSELTSENKRLEGRLHESSAVADERR